MFFRLKLALRLRECLSHPDGGGETSGKHPASSSDTSFPSSDHTSSSSKTAHSYRGNKIKAEPPSNASARLRREHLCKRSLLEEAKAKLSIIAEDLGSNNRRVVEVAVKHCYELSSENAKLRALFLELDIIRPLLNLTRSTNKTVKTFASLTLACLTSHEGCRNRLLEKGILKLCLTHLEGPEFSEDVKSAWFRAIGRFAKLNEAAKKLVEFRGLEIITHVVLNGSDVLKKRALIALYFIGADKPSIQASFVTAGAIDPLLKLCTCANPLVQLEAIDVCKVLSRSRPCADCFVAKSGIRIFVQVATEGPTKEIKDTAYRVLQRLCSHGAEFSQLIVQEGADITGCDLSEDGVVKLIDVFSNGVISLQEEAAKIVEELCETDPIASNELSQPSIVESLITLLSNASPDGVACAANSLSHMLSGVNVKTKVSEQEGAIQALLSTLVHGSERAADGAAVCLEKLSSHRKVAEDFVTVACVSKFLKALAFRGDRVQLPISRILFYLKAVKPCFLQNLIRCGGAQILVHRCWRGVSQVKVLCASLLADLCLDQTHMEQVVASGGTCVLLHLERHGIQEMRLPCGKALSRMEATPRMSERLLTERRIQATLTATLAMLERDQQLKLSPSIEEAIKMIPRHFFAPNNKEPAALAGKRITFENVSLELPSLDVHVQILEALQIQQGHTFLELGGGPGYLLALAKYLAGTESEVCGIDGDRVTAKFTRSAFKKLNEERANLEIHPSLERRPIPECFTTTRRFDRIVVSITIPKTLLGVLRLLLRANGMMVVPVEGQLLLIEKESGLHGARVLCPFHPLKILKQTHRHSRDPGGSVIVDPARSQPLPSSESSQNTQGSRIPHPGNGESSMRCQQQGGTRLARAQRDASGRVPVREGRNRVDPSRSHADRRLPLADAQPAQRRPSTREQSIADTLTEEQKREFAPFALSSRDVILCVSPNGKKQCLGEGGFGAVYRAVMNNVDEVAVKMVRGEKPTPQQKQSFLQEIRVLSALRHRNIVQFYGARIRPDCTFFVTEMMKGGDLYTAIRKHQETLRWDCYGKKIALDVALGLNYLHSRRPPMMHRDLKSPNVLLSEEGNAKIADVGMVRTQDRDLVTAQCIMTPLWAAPEVLKRQKTSTKADVWSYGVLIWEIATGHDIIEYDPLAYKFVERRRSQSEPGKTMIMPENAAPIARRIFTECTKEDPAERPDMKEVVQLLKNR